MRQLYEWYVTTRWPGCYVFLLDQSLAMAGPIGGTGLKKSVALADAINRMIAELISQCESGGPRIKRWFDVALVGYTTDGHNNPVVGPAFQGPLATGDDLIGIDRISECALGTKDEGGALVPVWYEPVARGGAPMCRGLERCEKVAAAWSAAHRDSVPPIVIHITGGQSTDGDPLAAARRLQGGVRTHKGGALLLNVHLSDESAQGVLFPSSEADLPNGDARRLFRMSSPLPDFCLRMMEQGFGWRVSVGMRGMAFNTDATALVTLVGTGSEGIPQMLAPPLPTGAPPCMDCGYLLQPEGAAAEGDGPPNLCSNPACGVANPPGERTCQRCGNPLPTAPGTVLHNRYKIEKLLAMGAFGAVYLATDLKAGNRPVAIKDMICPDPQEFTIRRDGFRREAETLRRLQGLPMVPRLFDLIEQGGAVQLVLEYIRGDDLLRILDRNNGRPFPAERVIAWGKSVCDLFAFMHRRSPPLLYRALAPYKLMLPEDGSGVRVVGFVLAHEMGRPPGGIRQLASYSEGYAPPEQIIGKPEPRSDLYALAGTLYHLLTGKSPEGFCTARELESQLASGNAPWPAEQRWLYELIKINLSEDVKDRSSSAAQVKADLERCRVTSRGF